MAHHSPISDYLADSESGEFDIDYESESECLVPKMKPNYDHQMSRRVTVRTPSEEDLHEQNKLSDQSRRPSAPYALSRHSSPFTDEERFLRKSKEKRQQGRDQSVSVTAGDKPATSPATASAPAAPAPATTGVPGVQPYNNPAGSTAALGYNNVYLHGTTNPNGFPPGHPFAINPHQPNAHYFHAVNFAGQSAPFFIANGPNTPIANMPQQLGGYQNSVPYNPGVMHFQPQTPDTSLGPMHHTYVPRFDGAGGVYMVQPGPGTATPAFQANTNNILPTAVYTHPPQAHQPMMMPNGNLGYPPSGAPILVGQDGSIPQYRHMMVNGGPAPMMPGSSLPPPAYYPVHNEPATGIGQTASEVAAACMMNPELNQPQDFKPADDNPSRMYMVRQLDGHYIQMPRATIDSFGDKGARWYCTDDGVFYAVRLDG